MRLPIRFAATAGVMTALLAACGGGSSQSDTNGSTGQVRLLNATDSPVDLYREEAKLGASVPSGSAGSYTALPATGHFLQTRRPAATGTLTGGGYLVDPGRRYTLVAYRTGNADGAAYIDESAEAPILAAAKLRVFNTSGETGPVDVYITPASQNMGMAPRVFTGISAPTFSAFTQLPAGNYRIRVTAADDPAGIRLDLPSVALSNAEVYTLVLTRTPGGVLTHGLLHRHQASLLALGNTSARVRVVASMTSQGTQVSARLGGTTHTLVSPQIGTYQQVPAGVSSIEVRMNGGPVVARTVNVVAGHDLTLVLMGSPNAPALSVIEDDNALPVSTTATKLRLVNGLNDLASPLTLIRDHTVIGSSDVPPGAASITSHLSAAAPSYEVWAQGSTQALLTGPLVLEGNRVYTLFVLGDRAGNFGGELIADR
ncbi:DUF4397 domain-containing protein [Rhizobacter sp. J219]|uniref:DUF4397 domain-containing protein n=1 Tax=Rhizobacter sp. J219 TaxID=2898430 RepID=UPI002151D9A2|nr:DUF4397 domain-containing protein [Rhizobacter sp. J219]MCR5885916.1 DUF4397 domain-containing protein [Rhizobacter sp. J219]